MFIQGFERPKATEFTCFRRSVANPISLLISWAIFCIFDSGSLIALCICIIFSGNCGISSIYSTIAFVRGTASFFSFNLRGIITRFNVTPSTTSIVYDFSSRPIFLSIRTIITRPKPAPSVLSKTWVKASSNDENCLALTILSKILLNSWRVRAELLLTSRTILSFLSWRDSLI